MKIERTKNATRNMAFGWIQSIYSMIIPFATRTAMIYFLGVQYLGLNSLFSSVLSVLNLAELGVGSAMVYSMYKPIAEDNTEKICALMRLYRTYYRIIGLVIATAGLAVTPLIPNLIKGSVPSGINVYILYLLNLASTVLTYWLFSYKNCLLSAHQRGDISTKISMIISMTTTAVQLLVLCFVRDYYLYLIVSLASGVVNNIVTAVIVTKMYPAYRPTGTLDRAEVKEINHRVADLFTSKIGTVVVNSVDTLVISAFLGLAVLAVYQNYFYIMTSIRTFITVIFSACTAGIGNSIVLESKEKNLQDLKKFLFIICWLSGFCSCCFLCLYQPFMKLWLGEELMLEFSIVVCIVVQFFIMEINQLLNLYKDAAGLWHEDRFRPLVTAGANLLMNLLMVHFWGLYGIMLSTVLSTLIVGMPWLLHNLFTVLFDWKDLKQFLLKILKYVAVVVLSCCVSLWICTRFHLGDWMTLLVRGGICCVVPNLIYLCVYYRMPEFKESLKLADQITKNKLQLERRILRKKGEF